MGDDINVVVPPPVIEREEEEDTFEKAGEELVALLTQQARELGECIARLAELENRLIQLEGREWANLEHSHEGFAEAGHGHNEYATTEHAHETERKTKEPDKSPEKQHPYFRRLSDL